MAAAVPPPAESAPNTPDEPASSYNSLARRSDRTESRVVALLLALWLVALPLCVIGGFFWWQHLSSVVAEQQGSRTRVVATTTADAPEFVVTQRGAPLTEQVPVQARWVGKTGAVFTGTVLTSAGAPAGATQQIWITRDGDQTEPPLDSTGAAVTVVLSSIALWVCWGGLLYAARMLFRGHLNRRRMADWDADWLLVEPRWSGRHPAP